ncbi:MAG: amidase, partial [Chitinophagales bacterium]
SSSRPHLAQAWGGLVVEGCNSRSVRDTAAYLDVISGSGLGEFHVLQGKPKQSFVAQLERPVEKLKIGFSSQHPMGLPVDEVCQKAVAHSAKLLSDLGHEVVEVPLPFQAADLAQVFLKIVSAEAAADLRLWTKMMRRKPKRSEIEPNTWTLALLGRMFSAADYAYAWMEAGAIARRLAEWHEEYDMLLTPTLANTPIKTGALQNNAAENILVNIINTFSLGSLLKASIKPFAEKAFGYIGYSPIANMTGQPAISLPLYHDETTNLPIGTMFSTKIGDDALLLRLAKQLEEAQPWFNKIPFIAGVDA